MCALGAAVARYTSGAHFLIAQLMVTAAQITAHYINEFADYDADLRIANRTSFSGGSGVLTSGALSRRFALGAGIVSSAIAVVAAALVAQFSVAAAALGLISLASSWLYSMPPVRLLNTGFGEVTTAITVAALVPAIGAYSQASTLPSQLVPMIIVLSLLQYAMLLAFELPDLETDAEAGKRPFGVRFGRRTTIVMVVVVVITAALVAAGAAVDGRLEMSGALSTLVAVPSALLMLWGIARDRHAATTFGAVSMFALCGLGLLVSTL